MKKTLLVLIMMLYCITINAQRIAVLDFNAGVGVSQSDVDGISAIFNTYFSPRGYTLVERTQINKAIDEQNFQRGSFTESQMVKIGQILNVSSVVVGDINIVAGQYNVDVRVINVQSGTIQAAEGATWTSGSSYRTMMSGIATKLANKIAINPVAPSAPIGGGNSSSTVRKRTSVETIYGYLKVFPEELGSFESVPNTVIKQLNNQTVHGYNTWRIPTNEELSLLKANGYLSGGTYMTKENTKGIVLLVTDGSDAKSSSGSNYTENAFGLDLKMVYVEGGSYDMGCTGEQGSSCDSDEQTVRYVTVSDFYIGQFEITQAQWQAVMGTSIYQQQSKAGGSSTYGTGNDYPMYYVSWEEAKEFCRRLSQQTGKTYRLPTEAEWEYAARGGKKTQNSKYSGGFSIDYVGWYTDNSGGKTHAVGTKAANELGIYDMSGNVWEWCEDWYGDYRSYDTDNPKGATSGSYRVNRGGSWFSSAECCRVSYRDYNSPGYRNYNLGFRVVCLP